MINFKKITVFILLILLSSQSVLASGVWVPIAIYDQYRIARNTEFMFINNSRDYFSYLLGDKLDPVGFFHAHRYFNGTPVNRTQTDLTLKMFNGNGNYRAPNDGDYSILKKYKKHFIPYQEGSEDGYIGYDSEYYSVSSVKNWLTWVDARNKVSKNIIFPENYYSGPFDYEQNCPLGVYERAIQTLNERRGQLNDKELEAFISNQDRIFLELCLQRRDNSYNDVPYENRTYSISSCEVQPPAIEVPKISLWTKIKKFFGFDSADKVAVPKPEETPRLFADTGDNISKQFSEDLDYQKATYLLYRGAFINTCYLKEAQNAFNKILQNKNHSYYSLATTGLSRAMLRQLFSDQKTLSPEEIKVRSEEILDLLNKNLVDPSLRIYRESFLVDKERLLAGYYSDTEFNRAGKELLKQNPIDLIHNLAVVNEQFQIRPEGQNIFELPDFPKFVALWNKTVDVKDIPGIVSSYEKASNKNLWLVLLTKKMSELPFDQVSLKYANMAIKSGNNSLFYPLQYYGNKILYKKDPGLAYNNVKLLLADPYINDIAYNYLSDLITTNAKDLDILVGHMGRKVSFYNYDYDIVGEEDGDGYSRIGRDMDAKIADKFGYNNYKFRKIENPNDDSIITFINFGLPLDTLYGNQTLKNMFAGQILARAFVLGRKDVYLPIAGTFSDQNLAVALNAKSEVAQNFLITYAILKNHTLNKEDLYGLNIHNRNFNSGNNITDWVPGCNYCHDNFPYGNGDLGAFEFPGEWEEWQKHDKTKDYNSRLLSSEEVKKNTKEKEQLFFTPIVRFFAENIINYAKANSKDSRIPEAIFYLVHFYRFNHYWDWDYDSDSYVRNDLANQDKEWAKKAFKLLPKYESSPWAKKAWPYDPDSD